MLTSVSKFVSGAVKYRKAKTDESAEGFDQALIDAGLKRGRDYSVEWPKAEHGKLGSYTFRRL